MKYLMILLLLAFTSCTGTKSLQRARVLDMQIEIRETSFGKFTIYHVIVYNEITCTTENVTVEKYTYDKLHIGYTFNHLE